MKVYYAHCLGLYGTEQEKRDIDLLTKKLGFEVLNPSEPAYCKGYEESPLGMEYFLRIVETCDALAFRSLPDLRISSGVAAEIGRARKLGLPIFELPNCVKGRTMTSEETVEYLEDVGQR